MSNEAFGVKDYLQVLWAPALIAIIISACVITEPHTVKAGNGDPDPRMEYLGFEKLQQPDIQGQPTRVLFYKDRVTNDEIQCFTGTFRETMSCFPSGRKR